MHKYSNYLDFTLPRAIFTFVKDGKELQFIVFKLHFLTITRVKQTIYISTKRNFGTWE